MYAFELSKQTRLFQRGIKQLFFGDRRKENSGKRKRAKRTKSTKKKGKGERCKSV